MSKICVTGGAGFIGSHVADLLIDAGHHVFVIDNLSTGKKENLNPKVKFYKISLADPKLVDIFMSEKPEIIMHLAAQSAVRVSLENPELDVTSNILGTINLLKAGVKSGVKKIIYSSTGGALYGEPRELPCSEEHPVKPLCPYGISKYAAEFYIENFCRLNKMGYTILRYANVYGPRQDPSGEAGVVAIFFGLLKEGKSPKIFGDGEQSRDFIYVGDVARINLKTAESPAKNTAFNIGTGKATSVNELFKKMKKVSGVKIEAEHIDAVPGEIRNIYLDSKKAKKELGFEVSVPLEEGLKKTWEYANRTH